MLAAAVEITIDPDVTAPERAPLLVLLSLLLSFAFIRMSTRLMRSPRVPWWPGSIKSGDLHLHHLVFGIVLVLVSGFLAFSVGIESPLIEILAVMFGIGAGLTLDEYALWLHLEDVYWAEEGRRSVDAVAIAAVFAGLVITVSPFASTNSASAVVVVVVVVKLLISATAVLKGKYVLGLVGFFIPGFSEVGAIRLARPESIWARKRYDDEGPKIVEARKREEKLDRRRERLRDLIGGAPSRMTKSVEAGDQAAE